jgi:hypothetical protein
MPGQVGNAQPMYCDGYGHMVPLPGPALAAGGTALTAAAGTITYVASGAGTGGSITFATGQTATDMAGNFTINASGTPAAGTVAVITFNNPLPDIPKAIIATMYDTDGTTNAVLGTNSVTVTGFQFVTDIALTASQIYTVNYVVVP